MLEMKIVLGPALRANRIGPASTVSDPVARRTALLVPAGGAGNASQMC
jgi:hypothetical protein